MSNTINCPYCGGEFENPINTNRKIYNNKRKKTKKSSIGKVLFSSLITAIIIAVIVTVLFYIYKPNWNALHMSWIFGMFSVIFSIVFLGGDKDVKMLLIWLPVISFGVFLGFVIVHQMTINGLM